MKPSHYSLVDPAGPGKVIDSGNDTSSSDTGPLCMHAAELTLALEK